MTKGGCGLVGVQREGKRSWKVKQSPDRRSALCGQNQASPWLKWRRSPVISLNLRSWGAGGYWTFSLVFIMHPFNPNVLHFYFLDGASDGKIWEQVLASFVTDLMQCWSLSREEIRVEWQMATCRHGTVSLYQLISARQCTVANCTHGRHGRPAPSDLMVESNEREVQRRPLPPSSPFQPFLLAPSSSPLVTTFSSKATLPLTHPTKAGPLAIPPSFLQGEERPSSKWPTLAAFFPSDCTLHPRLFSYSIKLVVKHAAPNSSQATRFLVSNHHCSLVLSN